MKKPFVVLKAILALCILAFVACKQENDQARFLNQKRQENERIIQAYIAEKELQMQRTQEGLYYAIEGEVQHDRTASDTLYPHVIIQYETYLIPYDTPIDRRYLIGSNDTLRYPFNTNYAYGQLRLPLGIDRAVAMMKPGQRATLLMNYLLGYGDAGNFMLPPYSPIRAEVQLIDVRSDSMLIAEYLERHNLLDDARTLEGGIQYISLTAPAPGAVVVGDSIAVRVRYVGQFLNGKTFDSSNLFTFYIPPQRDDQDPESAPLPPISGNQVIKGWQIGVSQMYEGEKGILIIPSKYAYGKQGSGQIPPHEPLVFTIEVLERVLAN